MTDSILDSVKEALGVPVDQPAFDSELILHINSVFSTLTQLGVGPVEGFVINDKTATWDDFIPNNLKMNDVKTFVFLRVKLIFDPPSTSFVIAAIQEQIKETAWRLNVTREETGWVDPDPDPIVIDPDPELT